MSDSLFDQRWVFVDVESDGPQPGRHSMLSCALVEMRIYPDGVEEVTNYYARLQPLSGARQHKATMAWWKTQPEAWAEARRGPYETPQGWAQRAHHFLTSDRLSPTIVSDFAAFDGAWLNFYLQEARLIGIPINVIDARSFVMGSWNLPQHKSGKSSWPKSWFPKDIPHDHNPLNDARNFGIAFLNAVRTCKGSRPDFSSKQ